jgi:serine protease Do
LWRPVQDRVKDTVVQIFSHVAAVNLLQPYAPPAHGASAGSGFFISDQGHIITNAHVVDQAKPWIQVPSLGKRIIDVEVIGVSPDRDLALLKVSPEGLDLIRKELGSVPYLPLGDSDLVRRSDDVLALGYPLGQQSLKSTTGVISGREQNLIQMDAAINPGSSGGPLLNTRGEVIGINSSGIVEAQNVGYAIPINDLRIILPDLHKVKVLRRPFLGVLFNNATDAMVEYLGNPAPGGCYVVEVIPGSPLDKVGVQSGDMIYGINGYTIDIFGEMKLPFSEDKVSIIDYVSRLAIGENLNLTVYRNGMRKEFNLTFGLPEQPAIHEIYPGYEDIDYEIFGGMVVMPLTLNHLPILGKQAPGLAKYVEARHQCQPTLIITHIFPNSQIYRSRSLPVGSTLNEVNGIPVHTLDDFREAIKKSEHTGFLTVKASDNVTRKSENILVVLPWQKVITEEPRLARDFRYPITKLAQNILQSHSINKSLSNSIVGPQTPELVVAKGAAPAA